MNLTREQQQFFTLLRAGLWNSPADYSLFSESTDWKNLFNIAKKQSSIGIIYDGILTLPKELRPARTFFLQWSNVIARIEEDNEHLNQKLKDVFTLYRNHGMTPVLLKGQGVAQNYRNPFHRQCGDIDVFIDKDFEKANDLLLPESTYHAEETAKHTMFHWHNVVVENHRIMTHLSSPIADSFFQKTVHSWYPVGDKVWIEDFEVSVPPKEFNAIFLLAHALNHFFFGGLGLKQITDWTCLNEAFKGRMDNELYNLYLDKTGLSKLARAFGAIAVEHMGMSAESLPFQLQQKDKELGEWLLDYIWEGGNFGFYKKKKKQRPKGYWASKWYTFTTSCQYCAKYFKLAPMEATCYPFGIAIDSLKMQLKKRFGFKF